MMHPAPECRILLAVLSYFPLTGSEGMTQRMASAWGVSSITHRAHFRACWL
jgi:hypothetical protein